MPADLSDAAVLFDLDGTLIDTAEDLAAAMNHALVAAGRRPVPAERVRHLVGRGARRMLERAFEENGDAPPAKEEMDRHIARFLEFYTANIAVHSRPFEGAVAAVEALRGSGAKIAICTNKREASATLLMSELGLSHLFEAIVGVDTVGIGKPDPRPVLHCLGLCRRPKAVFVGDSDVDIEAAAAAGLPSLIATFGYGPLTQRSEARALFHAYPQLAPLVRAALQR